MAVNFDPLSLHRSMIEAASWTLCAELARRNTNLRIVELHPGGGQYDCLSLVPGDGEGNRVLDANRLGRIHVRPWDPGHPEPWTWTQYLTARDPHAFVKEVEHVAGLVAPPTVPAATRASLSYRAIAMALATEVLGVRQLSALNGMVDTDNAPPCAREELFAQFPGAERAGNRGGHGYTRDPAYRFWFLLLSDDPVVAIDAETARCWWRDGTEHSVYDEYAGNGRRLTVAVARTLAPAVR